MSFVNTDKSRANTEADHDQDECAVHSQHFVLSYIYNCQLFMNGHSYAIHTQAFPVVSTRWLTNI